VLSGRGLCDGLITRQRSSTECGVSECDREASIMRKPWPTSGCCAMEKNEKINKQKTFHLSSNVTS
jgi:hypothetical protein